MLDEMNSIPNLTSLDINVRILALSVTIGRLFMANLRQHVMQRTAWQASKCALNLSVQLPVVVVVALSETIILCSGTTRILFSCLTKTPDGKNAVIITFAAIAHLLTAKSRVKKFWSKGKNSSKLNGDNKPLSLSQPNLAALDRDAEVKPITMYEMSVGHSIDGK